MDRICNALLEKINALTGVGRYVILSEEEFFECFPDDAEKTDGELKRALKKMISDGYVDLKYSSGNMFCVAPLRPYAPEESAPPAPQPAPESARAKRQSLSLFLAAFTGGMAGSLFIGLLLALIG